MKLTAKTDLDAPSGFVYEALADHQRWERDAAQRGHRVERMADMPLSGPGAGWIVHLPFRGKMVKLQLQLVDQKPPEQLRFALLSNSFEGEITMTVAALSPRRTRLHMAIDISPRTVMARVLINTLRLAKGRAQARLEARLAQMGGQIESRWHEANR